MSLPVLKNQKGFALVIAILISAALLATAMGVLSFINKSTTISGVGKGYATAEKAADGAVSLMQKTVNLTHWGEPVPTDVYEDSDNCLAEAIIGGVNECTVNVDLPGIGSQGYAAEIKVERLYHMVVPGGRIEFAAPGSSVNSTAIFYRISTQVTGNNETSAETSVLYRFAG